MVGQYLWNHYCHGLHKENLELVPVVVCVENDHFNKKKIGYHINLFADLLILA